MDEGAPAVIGGSHPAQARGRAVLFTIVPFVGGVMLANVVTWARVLLPRYGDLDADALFVVNVGLVVGVAGICGAVWGTYGYLRQRRLRQPGLWLMLAAGCFSGEVSRVSVNPLPLSFGLDLRLATAHIGINAIGVVLLIAYSWETSGVSPELLRELDAEEERLRDGGGEGGGPEEGDGT